MSKFAMVPKKYIVKASSQDNLELFQLACKISNEESVDLNDSFELPAGTRIAAEAADVAYSIEGKPEEDRVDTPLENDGTSMTLRPRSYE